jgi:hypothetical protein
MKNKEENEEKILRNFFKKLNDSQKDIDKEFLDIVDEKFFDLI